MSFGGYDPTKQASYSNRPKRFYLKEGSNLYRVLPPTKSLKDRNKIAQYWSIIWLTDSRGKKRPVSSIFRKNKDVILQHDPLITKIDEMKREYDLALASNANPAVIAAMKENMKRIYNKKVYALNVISAGGELGVLEIPYTSYQNLEQRIRELYNQGIDAIGVGEDKGVYFDFKKTKDERGRVVYPVDAATKTTKDASGNFIITYVRAPLSQEDAARLAEQAEDLTQLYRELSVDEMTALSTLDQRVFDAVFARPQAATEETGDEEDQEQEQVQYQQQAVGVQSNLGTTQTMRSQQTVLPTGNVGSAVPGNAQPVFSQQTVQPAVTGFSQGSVLNNDKVKNFLFPDKK